MQPQEPVWAGDNEAWTLVSFVQRTHRSQQLLIWLPWSNF